MSIADDEAGIFPWGRDLVLWILLVLCLAPVTIDRLSVNYLFLAYPAWLLVSGRRLQWPPRMLLVAVGWYLLIFIAGVLTDLWSGETIQLRSISSFLIFMSVFSLSVFDLTEREIRIFKFAVITAAAISASVALFHYYWAGGNDAGFSQKDIVGSQRYGFVYFMAFCIVMTRRPSLNIAIAPRIALVGLLLAGMLLTFSRSTVITFGTVAGLYVLVSAYAGRDSLAGMARSVARHASVVAVCLVALAVVMPMPFKFYNYHIFARYVPVLEYLAAQTDGLDKLTTKSLSDAEAKDSIVEDVFNRVGSEGTRVILWSLAFDYVAEHPVLGSRYLGIWTIDGAPSGSAHNQFVDTLLRTGWPGFAIYLCLLGWILLCLFRVDRGLFWGFLGILICGVFHETFKESQGAFLLAFMIGILATTARSGHSVAPNNTISRVDSEDEGRLVTGG